MSNTPDYSAFTKKTKADETVTLGELSELATKLEDATADVKQKELELKRAKGVAAYLAEESIPEKMQALKLVDFRTQSGFRIELDEKVFAHISEENAPEAHKWMDANGHGGMIKRHVVAAVNTPKEVAVLMRFLGKKCAGVKAQCGVHPSTLRAWAKRIMKEDGTEIPSCISIETKDVAKVTKKK